MAEQIDSIENWDKIQNIFFSGAISNGTTTDPTDNWERIKEIFLLTASSETETLDGSEANSTVETEESAGTSTSANT